MDTPFSRRDALRSVGAALAAAGMLDWAAVARAAHEAHEAAKSPQTSSYTLLDGAQAADVAALVAQILPSDETPGASEAGASFFIDRALGSFFAHWRPAFMEGLAQFQAAARQAHPESPSFSALSPEQQIAFLHGVDTSPFFDQARLLTLCGMFSSPEYGGNRDGVGWKLMGFEDQHIFEPPFGFYDQGHHDR